MKATIPKAWARAANGDAWLLERLKKVGTAPDLLAGAVLAGDLVRLAPPGAFDLAALLAGKFSTPVVDEVHPWVAALTPAAKRALALQLRDGLKALDKLVDDLERDYSPDSKAWTARLVGWLSTRDELASLDWVLTASGARHGVDVAGYDRKHRPVLLSFVDLQPHPSPRLELARVDDEAWWAEVLP